MTTSAIRRLTGTPSPTRSGATTGVQLAWTSCARPVASDHCRRRAVRPRRRWRYAATTASGGSRQLATSVEIPECRPSLLPDRRQFPGRHASGLACGPHAPRSIDGGIHDTNLRQMALDGIRRPSSPPGRCGRVPDSRTTSFADAFFDTRFRAPCDTSCRAGRHDVTDAIATWPTTSRPRSPRLDLAARGSATVLGQPVSPDYGGWTAILDEFGVPRHVRWHERGPWPDLHRLAAGSTTTRRPTSPASPWTPSTSRRAGDCPSRVPRPSSVLIDDLAATSRQTSGSNPWRASRA